MCPGTRGVSTSVVTSTTTEAPRRESGKDSLVKGGGQTPPDTSLEARKTRQPEPRLLKIDRWDPPGKDPKVAKLCNLFLGMRKDLATSPKEGTLSQTSDEKQMVDTLRGKIKESATLLAETRVKTQKPDQLPSQNIDELLAELLSIETPKDPKDQAPKTVSPSVVKEETQVKTQETIQLSTKVLDDLLADLETWGALKELSPAFIKKINDSLAWQPSTFRVTPNSAATTNKDALALGARELMIKAEEVRDLAVNLLMQRTSNLGDKFAAMSREEMSKSLDDAPLARLPAEDRMLMASLRVKFQQLMGMADDITASADSGDAANAAKPEIKRLNAAAKDCEKRLSKLIERLPNSEQWQPLLDNARAGQTVEFSDKKITDLLAGYTKSHKTAFAKSIAGLFNAPAIMRQEAAILGAGGKTALATRAISESAARQWDCSVTASNTDPSIALGLTLLKASISKQRPIDDSKDFATAMNRLYGNKDVILSTLGGKGSLPPIRQSNAGAQKMLADIMSPPQKRPPADKEFQEVNLLVWKFNQAMRFNVDKRLYMGLTPNMRGQLKVFANNARLSHRGKDALRTKLQAIFDSHFPALPEGVDLVKGIGSGKSKPQILKMEGWDRPVLLKKLASNSSTPTQLFNEKIRELAFNSLTANNVNSPKVLGVALPKGRNLKSPEARIIFETVPGKALASFVPGMGTASAGDPLLTAMSPMARAKAAVHLVSGAIRGLAPLHAMGLVHCDIKPGNIMLHDKTLEPCLIDFGSMSKPGEYAAVTTGYVPDDEHTASLELDIFSLGKTLMELAYGQLLPGMSVFLYMPTIAKDNYWQKNGDVKQILAAANILSKEDSKERPTIDQLLAIVEGRDEIPRATSQGGASTADLQVLQTVFGPKGLFAGGRDEIAKHME